MYIIKLKFSTRILIYSIECDGRDKQKRNVAGFPLWSLQKQNGSLKRSENNMKDIIGISIVYGRVHLI